ncbi:peptidoglycan-binding domain-containing protein [Prauserella alba]|uniref:Peptidoglycan binding-like domain-containing protein n=1 Tax=Prauserella alba TaxID=176898 RepID=A0ABP4G9E6_9PSEU|nr:peptidoglycan-binding domain-containing protein [Prauserella alba]MCP2181100.1 putative peptidoglycan binding domain-containing protein [Prauserella alba]
MLRGLWLVGVAAAVVLFVVGCSSEDPWEAYVEQVNKGGGEMKTGQPLDVNDEAARQEFEQAKSITCQMSKEDLMGLKALGSMSGPEAAKRAANQMGALWEFACDKGYDPEMYQPEKAAGIDEIEPPPMDDFPSASPEESTPEPAAPESSPELPDVADDPLWPSWPGTVYTYGDCDPALVDWQLQMNTYGYDFQGTGCYAEETEEAVLDLQEANSLPTSGKLGPETWDAAWAGVPPG